MNALILGWTGTGNAQAQTDLSSQTCRSYDLWSNAQNSPVFIGPLFMSMEGVDAPETVRVSLSGLRNNQLTTQNAAVATQLLVEFFDEGCDGVDRDASNLGSAPAQAEPTATTEPAATPTPAPEPTATPEPEPTATAEPQPTATPEPQPTATLVPDPTPIPTAVFVPTEGDTNDSEPATPSTTTPSTSTPSTSTPSTTAPTPGALANTGNGPLTSKLALTGFGLVFIGAVISAVEERRFSQS